MVGRDQTAGQYYQNNPMQLFVPTLMASPVAGPFCQEPFLISPICYNRSTAGGGNSTTLIPALTGRPPCSREERDLLALLVRLGGIGIVNPISMSQHVFEASVKLTSPLVVTIISQDPRSNSGCIQSRGNQGVNPAVQSRSSGATS